MSRRWNFATQSMSRESGWPWWVTLPAGAVFLVLLANLATVLRWVTS